MKERETVRMLMRPEKKWEAEEPQRKRSQPDRNPTFRDQKRSTDSHTKYQNNTSKHYRWLDSGSARMVQKRRHIPGERPPHTTKNPTKTRKRHAEKTKFRISQTTSAGNQPTANETTRP
eukprot:2738794-Prymnesium_polylepis.1